MVDKAKMTAGLVKLRQGIELIRDSQDEIRMSVMSMEGEPYQWVDLACIILSRSTDIPWQVYERLRSRYGR